MLVVVGCFRLLRLARRGRNRFASAPERDTPKPPYVVFVPGHSTRLVLPSIYLNFRPFRRGNSESVCGCQASHAYSSNTVDYCSVVYLREFVVLDGTRESVVGSSFCVLRSIPSKTKNPDLRPPRLKKTRCVFRI